MKKNNFFSILVHTKSKKGWFFKMDEKNNENLEVLKELHKAAKMGMDSLSFVSEKVEQDDCFKDNLSFQYTQYGQMLDRINKLYEDYGQIPEENTFMNTAMGWTGVQMNTLNDKSTSHLADMLIQGSTMGIIEGRKLLNHKTNGIEEAVKNLTNEFVAFQENNVEQLKKFL